MFDGIGISFGMGIDFGEDAPKRKGGKGPKQPKEPRQAKQEAWRPYGVTRPGENICWGYGPAKPPSDSGTDSLSSSPGKSDAFREVSTSPKAPAPTAPAPKTKPAPQRPQTPPPAPVEADKK